LTTSRGAPKPLLRRSLSGPRSTRTAARTAHTTYYRVRQDTAAIREWAPVNGLAVSRRRELAFPVQAEQATVPRLAVGAESRPPLPLRLLAAVPGLGTLVSPPLGPGRSPFPPPIPAS